MGEWVVLVVVVLMWWWWLCAVSGSTVPWPVRAVERSVPK